MSQKQECFGDPCDTLLAATRCRALISDANVPERGAERALRQVDMCCQVRGVCGCLRC